jgi:hypothetical protein
MKPAYHQQKQLKLKKRHLGLEQLVQKPPAMNFYPGFSACFLFFSAEQSKNQSMNCLNLVVQVCLEPKYCKNPTGKLLKSLIFSKISKKFFRIKQNKQK